MPVSGTPDPRHTMVSSVVNVPKEAKSLANQPKYKAKMDENSKMYAVSCKPFKSAFLRGGFGEATILMKQGYRS